MRSFTSILVACLALSVSAFVPASRNGNKIASLSKQSTASPFTSSVQRTTELSERRWNFNEGQSPWGLKKNAETWNGRVAQMAFVWIFIQELVSGKGVLNGLNEGDAFFVANAAAFGVCVVGLTAWLAIQGDDDFTKD